MVETQDLIFQNSVKARARAALSAVGSSVRPAFSLAAALGNHLWLFGTLFLILVISFAYQEYLQSAGIKGFLRAPWIAAIVAALAYLVLAAVIEYFKHNTVAPVFVAILFFLGGIRLIGAYSFYHDFVCWLIGIAVTAAVVAVWRKRSLVKNQPSPYKPTAADVRLYVATFLLVTWLSLWAADSIFQRHPISRDAGWIETHYRYAHDSARGFGYLKGTETARIGLALSGGGYRAALMHAGVLSLLDSLGAHPQAISSVSGGSIIGSFYHAGGRPSAFLQAMQDGRFHLRREIFHPRNLLLILATLPIPRTTYRVLPFNVHNRTHVQAEMLDRLFLDNAAFGGKEEQIRRGQLMLCATELHGGSLVGFMSNGAVVKPIDPPVWRFRSLNMKRMPSAVSFLPWSKHALRMNHTALLVAASGAFPGAFKPVRIAISGELPANSAVRNPMVLSDGGIGDNLGLVLLYSAAELANSLDAPVGLSKQWSVNVVIASDGSALSAPQIPSNTMRVLTSAIDAVGRTSGAASLVNVNPPPVILSPAPLIRDIQRALSKAEAPEGLVTLPFENQTHQLGAERRTENAGRPDAEPTLSYWNLDMNDLRFFAAHMKLAPADTTAFSRELAEAQSRIAAGRVPGAQAELEQSLEKSLHHRIELELARRIKVFINTGTLDDRVSRENAEALYILGQYLVVLNKPFISYALRNARPPKTTPVAASLQARM